LTSKIYRFIIPAARRSVVAQPMVRLGWQLRSTHPSPGTKSYNILGNHLMQLRNGSCCRTAHGVRQELQIITTVTAVEVLGVFTMLHIITAANAAGDGSRGAAASDAVTAEASQTRLAAQQLQQQQQQQKLMAGSMCYRQALAAAGHSMLLGGAACCSL
jgi:hypothetical protein